MRVTIIGPTPPLLLRVYKPHVNGLCDSPAYMPYMTHESHHLWACAPFIATGLQTHVTIYAPHVIGFMPGTASPTLLAYLPVPDLGLRANYPSRSTPIGLHAGTTRPTCLAYVLIGLNRVD